jgi:7-keto-8-aminopelargonate synthetase-like enzyme
MGTFSKALGGAGAYAAASKIMISTLVNRARGFIYSTALPPATVAAARCAICVVQEDASLLQNLWTNLRYLQHCFDEQGLSSFLAGELKSPIVPIVLGRSEKTVHVSQLLLEAGYFVQGIRPPTVPPNTGRLRIALNAAHSKEQIKGLVNTLKIILNDSKLS